MVEEGDLPNITACERGLSLLMTYPLLARFGWTSGVICLSLVSWRRGYSNWVTCQHLWGRAWEVWSTSSIVRLWNRSLSPIKMPAHAEMKTCHSIGGRYHLIYSFGKCFSLATLSLGSESSLDLRRSIAFISGHSKSICHILLLEVNSPSSQAWPKSSVSKHFPSNI